MEKNKSISYAKNFHPNSKIDKDSAIVVRNLSLNILIVKIIFLKILI